MTAPAITVNLSAQIDSTQGPVSIGTMLVPVGGLYVVATPANRALGGRAHGIALTAWGTSIPGSVRLQHVGIVDSAVTGLGTGAASWVRVSAAGIPERCTPSGADDVIGWCWTDGTLMMLCGLLTAGIVNGSGGGATLPINLAGGSGTVINLLPAANQASQTLAGDVTGTTAASVISNLAVAKLAPSGTNGFVLTTTGGVPVWATPTGGYTPPTGTGFPHITAGAQDGAAVSLTWTGDATGTGTGSSFALTVVKVNGATVPAAGALTTGNAAYVSGVSALTYSALNLAGGAGWVTGVLPAANQAAQTMAGDVTGTTAASVVAKVNGATYPAAGALTTGTIPRVTGVSAVAYGALDLANASAVTGVLPTGNQASQAMAGDVTGTTAASVVSKVKGTTITTAGGGLTVDSVLRVTGVSTADWGQLNLSSGGAVTGVLPAANVTQATGTGFPHVTAGVLDTASIKVDTTNSAHVVVPSTAGGVITSNGGSLVQPLNVLAGTNFVSIGSGASSTGAIRLANAFDIRIRDAGNAGDRVMMVMDSSNQMFVGTDPGFTTTLPGITRIAGTQMILGTSTSQDMFLSGSNIQLLFPIIGNSSGSSPFSAHGKTTVSAAAPHTMTAAEYSPDAIMLSAVGTGTWTFPLPASDAGAYYKTIINSGNGTKTISNGGTSSASIPANSTGRCLFDTAGVHLTGATVAYP